MLASIWTFLSPILKPLWNSLFKFLPYIASFVMGRKRGVDKETLKQTQKTVERYKKTNEIQTRPLLSLSAVRKRLRKR